MATLPAVQAWPSHLNPTVGLLPLRGRLEDLPNADLERFTEEVNRLGIPI
jgi:hypothetical protein